MKVKIYVEKRPRIAILPMIDIVFLLLVFFIYGMLSMASHRGLSVKLPESSTAQIDKRPLLSICVHKDRTVYLNDKIVAIESLTRVIQKNLKIQKLQKYFFLKINSFHIRFFFNVMDKIKIA